MYLAVVATHIVLSVLLIFIILVQPGRGGDVGAAFGGGDSNLFGPRGAGNLLSRITTFVAVGFFVTSVTLAWYSNREVLANSNVLDEIERENQERLQKKEAAEGTEGALQTPADVPVVPLEAVPSGEAERAPGAPSEPADPSAPSEAPAP